MKYPCLDLFSGIGGIALGLQDIAKTVGYCEIDDACANVLEQNKSKGFIEDAPIFRDVQRLNLDDLMSLHIEMITAGSPCQDISMANPYAKGIHGPKSKLIFEVIRIAKLVMPTLKCIVLENSSAIVHRGMDDVLSQLRDMNFSYIWSIGSATEVGALHHRKRWICIAFAQGHDPYCPEQAKPTINGVQCSTEPLRIVVSKKTNTESVRECGLLGNSVVPSFMQHMYQELVRLYKCTDINDSINDRDNNTQRKNTHRCEVWNADTQLLSPLRRKFNATETNLALVFQEGNTRYERSLWSTPRKSAWFRCKQLNDRTLLYLTTKILYEDDTQRQMHALMDTTDHTKFHVNPRFVEWLMGFPYNWVDST